MQINLEKNLPYIMFAFKILKDIRIYHNLYVKHVEELIIKIAFRLLFKRVVKNVCK